MDESFYFVHSLFLYKSVIGNIISRVLTNIFLLRLQPYNRFLLL